MKTYIALLRGINVGGKNKVPMSMLKSAFEEIGFCQVSTYINSGNVIFRSDIEDKIKIIDMCRAVIQKQFMLSIPVAVVEAEELSQMLGHAPTWWDAPSDCEMAHQAIFLIPPITAAQVYEAVGEAKAEYEQVGHYEGVIFWSAARATFSRTRWSKISSKSVYDKLTIRNANTTKKLLILSQQCADNDKKE